MFHSSALFLSLWSNQQRGYGCKKKIGGGGTRKEEKRWLFGKCIESNGDTMGCFAFQITKYQLLVSTLNGFQLKEE